jgi:hypothetical protein
MRRASSVLKKTDKPGILQKLAEVRLQKQLDLLRIQERQQRQVNHLLLHRRAALAKKNRITAIHLPLPIIQ